jgi:hypothetical protein
MEDAVCYWRYSEAEEVKRAPQQAKTREAQAERGDRINDLLTEAKKQAEKTAPKETAIREVASAK